MYYQKNITVDIILFLLISLVLIVLVVMYVMFKKVYKNKGNIKNEQVFEDIELKENEQLVAVIMSAISCCYYDSKFNIKSIKRINGTVSTWGMAGRNDIINSRL